MHQRIDIGGYAREIEPFDDEYIDPNALRELVTLKNCRVTIDVNPQYLLACGAEHYLNFVITRTGLKINPETRTLMEQCERVVHVAITPTGGPDQTGPTDGAGSIHVYGDDVGEAVRNALAAVHDYNAAIERRAALAEYAGHTADGLGSPGADWFGPHYVPPGRPGAVTSDEHIDAQDFP